ncbi:extracellular solute-binding protein [Treponema sp. OMZ 840]|uniref:hypothetical protein n=1 Tax=Treponema sp. OMZ 840 TaxID=244313 RepID=UPI003D935856
MNKQKNAWPALCAFLSFLLCCISAAVSFVSCKAAYEQPVILWTNQSEFITYAELFNATSEKVKVLVVYKENPVEAFPPAKDEELPDIIVGPWLKNKSIRGNFMPLDYLFDDQLLKRSIFYPQLLKLGNVNNKQYLLPVSFNLSALIFSTDYTDLIPDNYMLNPDQIREAGALLNKKNGKGIYTFMGFAPRWTPEFLYQTAKLNGADFSEAAGQDDTFIWNQVALDKTVAYLRSWTETVNTSTAAEDDYQFKYLYNPHIKWITEKHCLFAYINSSTLFSTAPEKLHGVDFRWIQKDNKIPIEDDMISMGMYKHSKNLAAAELFIVWFMNTENQKNMLEWRSDLNLYTNTFGISGGFSSIRTVNERIFPIFYPALLGNLPAAEYLSTPNILPANWKQIKTNIIVPYLLSGTNTNNPEPEKTIQQLTADWKRRSY